MSERIMQHEDNSRSEASLDELFAAYRDSLPDPVPSVNFTPELWARIEAREVSSTLFGRMAKALVTAALAASMILGLMVSTLSKKEAASFTGTYLEALSADHASTMEPLNLDRVSEMEQQ